MTDDKSKLLRSLTIDRSASEAGRSGRRWLPISAGVRLRLVAFAVLGRRRDFGCKTVQRDHIPAAASRRRHNPSNSRPLRRQGGR